MITLNSTRTIHAPRWLCFEMVRNVDVHAAAIPEIKAHAEDGRQHSALELGEWTRWSARYYGLRLGITMKVTGCDWPISYDETNQGGIFKVFQHRYKLLRITENITRVSDRMEFESGFGWIGKLVDYYLLAPTLSKALERRMDHIKAWSENDTWQFWISETDVQYLKGKRTAD